MKKLLFALLLALPQIALAGQSIYTSVAPADCVEIISSNLIEEPEIDFYTANCPGFDDYRVMVSGSDIRYNIDLYYQGKEVKLWNPYYSFHDLGSDKIEWRYQRDPRTKRARVTALIYRINSSYPTETGDLGNRSYLHVVKLDGHNTCTVAVLSDEQNMNEKARRIADNIDSVSCMPERD